MQPRLLTKNESSRSVPLPSQTVRFWTYLFSNIFSILCSFVALYLLLTDRALRRALNNHTIIILLIIVLIHELTSITWQLYDDHNHAPLIKSELFYQFWTFFDYPLVALQLGLFAWTTIERHILIFHDQWVATARKRFFIHYLPIGMIISYYLIYYSILHFVPLCEQSYDAFIAGNVFIPCVFDHTVLGVWDLTIHQLVAILIIIFFSLALLLRTIWQKNRLRQRINWRKYRKMTIQLLSFSTIYIIFDAPLVFMIFGYQFGLPPDIALPILVYTGFLSYYVMFLFPFVCCLSLPELRKKFRTRVLHCRPTQQIGPVTLIRERAVRATTIVSSRRNI